MLYNGRSYAYADIQFAGFPGDVILFTSGLRSIECSDEAKLVEPKGPGAIALPTGSAYEYIVTAQAEVVTDVWETLLPGLPDAYAEEKFNLNLIVGKKGGSLIKRDFIETQIISVKENWRRDAQDGLISALTLKV